LSYSRGIYADGVVQAACVDGVLEVLLLLVPLELGPAGAAHTIIAKMCCLQDLVTKAWNLYGVALLYLSLMRVSASLDQ
jgi:hypothetical protein